jgi:uracil-DNA glycosylase
MSKLADELERIWGNWRNNQDQCNGCPHYGAGGGDAPFYGVGSVSNDTEVIIVGKEPGQGDDPTDADDIVRYIQSEYPGNFRDHRSKRIESTGMYEEYSNNLTALIALLRVRDIKFYFTNLKKCRETDDGKTQEAISACSEYLFREIEALDPSVIVTLGGEATKSVYDKYPSVYQDYDDIPAGIRNADEPTKTKRITKDALRPRQAGDVTIISSVHFSYLGPNLEHVPSIPTEDVIPENKGLTQRERVAMYWTRLVEQIEDELS